MKTVVVMVAPSALADTVTPPIVSPDGNLITPDRIASASAAGATIVTANAAARRTNVSFFMASSPQCFSGLAACGGTVLR